MGARDGNRDQVYSFPSHSCLHLAARPCLTLQTLLSALAGHHGHTRPRGPRPPHTQQLLGLRPVPPPSPTLTRTGSQECPLPGCCPHTQSLVNGVSPPLGNPGPLPSMCCAQPPPKESGVEGGKGTARWRTRQRPPQPNDQGHIHRHKSHCQQAPLTGCAEDT